MLCKSVKPFPRYRNFYVVCMPAAPIFDFFRSQIVTDQSPIGHEGRTASPCQISLQSLKLWLRYDEFSIFQNGGHHVGFLKLQIFNLGRIISVELRHRARFRSDRSNRCRDISILVLFKMTAATIFKDRNGLAVR